MLEHVDVDVDVRRNLSLHCRPLRHLKRQKQYRMCLCYNLQATLFIIIIILQLWQYEDLEVLSQTAREVWLAEQCAAFETQIQNLSREKEKDHFIEELYRKLKQVTRRWQSWNHRSFGGVTSRGCVDFFLRVLQ